MRALPGVADAAPRYVVQGADSFALGEPVKLVAFPGDHTALRGPAARRRAAPARQTTRPRSASASPQALGIGVGSTLAVQLPAAARRASASSAPCARSTTTAASPTCARRGVLAADPGATPQIVVKLAPRRRPRGGRRGALATLGAQPAAGRRRRPRATAPSSARWPRCCASWRSSTRSSASTRSCRALGARRRASARRRSRCCAPPAPRAPPSAPCWPAPRSPSRSPPRSSRSRSSGSCSRPLVGHLAAGYADLAAAVLGRPGRAGRSAGWRCSARRGGRLGRAARDGARRSLAGAEGGVMRAAVARSRSSRSRSRAAAASGARPPGARRLDARARRWRDPDGDGFLTRGPGEPLRDRTDLARATPARPHAGDASRSSPTCTCATRSRPRGCRSSTASAAPFSSTFRPQEALSAAGARRRRALGQRRAPATPSSSPATSSTTRRPTSSRWRARSSTAARADPDSGAPGYDGRAGGRRPRPRLLPPRRRPAAPPGPARRRPAALPRARPARALVRGARQPRPAGRRRAGPHALDRARSPSAASASSRPTPGSTCRAARTRSRRSSSTARSAAGCPGRTARVAPDPAPPRADPGRGRRGAARRQRPRRHRRAHGLRLRRRPRGARSSCSTPCAATSARAACCRAAQTRWLREPARRAPATRRVIVVSHQPLTSVDGGAGGAGRCSTPIATSWRRWPATRTTTASSPRHTATGGYWLVQTASLADYPQQARVLRVRETAGGGTALETWMLDTAPGPLAGHRARARLSRRAGRAAAARGRDGGLTATCGSICLSAR